jgi:Sulfotransferase family
VAGVAIFTTAQNLEGEQMISPQLAGEQLAPVKLAFRPEEVLLRANALFLKERVPDLWGSVAAKIDELQRYDVLAMDTVVAVLMWGRSGSLLLCSYLDGHDDVIMMPELCSEGLYEFFERYPSFSWRDKLLAFPVFEQNAPRFFEGDFAISPAEYYAAVQAILAFYAQWPPEFLESRRAFFLFVHVAYTLALGRRPASSHPVIVYMQHVWDDTAARRLVEDFPQSKFVHTIRDPISSCDAAFHFHLKYVEKHILLPHTALHCLANKDRPHSGMESRTRTIRFEDLHSDTTGTMHDLSDWLGLPYQPSLLDSTFNGIPYVVKRDGVAWSGRRVEQVRRRSLALSRKDRALLFALFYENFMDWDYPCPKIFQYPTVRLMTVLALFIFPMKMEMISARAVFRLSILPALRRGNIWLAIKPLRAIAFCRLKIIRLLLPAFIQRCARRPALLRVFPRTQPAKRPDVGADELQESI